LLKVCAGIVTLNPDINRLVSNIDAIRYQVEKVFVFDNGSLDIEVWKKEIPNVKEIYFIENKKNIGIAAALNSLCERVKSEGYSWCITLDQDSVCPKGIIEEFLQNISSNVAIIAPNVVYRNNEKYKMRGVGVERVEWVITSASCMNLDIWEKIKFDESLFIDGVDRDYCIRANRSGYVVLKDYNVELIHELGNLKCKKLFDRVVYVTYHSDFRKYYMARNAIYLDFKLNEDRGKKIVLKLLIKTLVYEKSLKGIIAIFKGINDGRKMTR